MGRIKEFFHEEICQGQQEALKQKEKDLEEAIISAASEIEEDLVNAQLPRWMHQDASVGQINPSGGDVTGS